MAKEPYITFPLLPLAHIVNVSLPGQVNMPAQSAATAALQFGLLAAGPGWGFFKAWAQRKQ